MGGQNNKSIFHGFSHKTNFILGVGSTIAVFSMIGFFVMLGITFNKEDARGNTVAPSRNVAVAPTPTPSVQAPPSVPGDIPLVPISDADWIKGDRNAKISIVEFSDTECPFCKRIHPTLQQVVDQYDGDVNWVYRHFPLASLHQKAQREAEAAECAGELAGNDGFWTYLDRIFEITPSNDGLQDSQLFDIADFVGLDRGAFTTCLESGKYAQKVLDGVAQATAAGGRGTPYSVIVAGDQKIPVSGAVPIAQFQSIIDSLL